jgi:MFS family permease
MNDQPLRRRPLWILLWGFASMVGFAVLSVVGFVVGEMIVGIFVDDPAAKLDEEGWTFFFYLTGAFALGGIGWAGAQWLLLRKRAEGGALRWISGGFAGFAVLGMLYFALYERVPELVSEIVHNAAGGIVLGLLQVPIVRSLTGRANGWTLVCAAALIGAGITHLVVRGLGGSDDLAGPLGVLVAALVIGTVLSGWLGEPAAAASTEEHAAAELTPPAPTAAPL